jgi:hypothetical protein
MEWWEIEWVGETRASQAYNFKPGDGQVNWKNTTPLLIWLYTQRAVQSARDGNSMLSGRRLLLRFVCHGIRALCGFAKCVLYVFNCVLWPRPRCYCCCEAMDHNIFIGFCGGENLLMSFHWNGMGNLRNWNHAHTFKLKITALILWGSPSTYYHQKLP